MNRLEELRYRKGKSVSDVAVELGVNPNSVTQWERGAVIPSPYNPDKLAEYYGVEASELQLGAPRRSGRPPRYFNAGHPDGVRVKVTE